MKSRGLTVQNYLVDGNPEGVVLTYVSQWTGQAVRVPRNLIKDNLDLEEISRPGLYFLVGADIDNPDRKLVYTGEANNISERVRYHLRDDNKDFFEAIIAFTSKDENLTVSHTKYLEKRVIDIINKNAEFESVNGKLGNMVNLPRMVVDEMETFIDYVKVVLPTMGYRFLDDHSTRVKRKKNEDLYHIDMRQMKASAKLIANGVVVLKGSQFRNADNESLSGSYKNLRATLIERGIVVKETDNYSLFTDDYEFSSPSQAAAIVLGYSVNGRVAWKNSRGQTIKDLEEIQSTSN